MAFSRICKNTLLAMIIAFIIFNFDIIILLYWIYVLIKYVSSHNRGIHYYKIVNIKTSLIGISIYIIIFYGILYYYRILNRTRAYDLTLVYNKIMSYFEAHDISLCYLITLSVILLLIIINILLLLLALHKTLSLEIFKVYLFMNYENFLIYGNTFLNSIYKKQDLQSNVVHHPDNHLCTVLINKMFQYLKIIANRNLLIFVCARIFYHLFAFLQDMEKFHNKRFNRYEPLTHPIYVCIQKILNMTFLQKKNVYLLDTLFLISPFIVLIYDCLFNSFVLQHIFHYLPYYVPVILLQRITTIIGHSDANVQELMWEIYYNNENCIYLATNLHKNYLMYFMRNYLLLPLNGSVEQALISENLYTLKNSPLRYRLVIPKYYLYQNDFGDYAHETLDKKFFFVEDYDIVNDQLEVTYGEELTIIIDKRKNESTNFEPN